MLQLIAEGRTMKEVAAILNISSRTAEAHKYELMATLGVRTTAALVQHAIKAGRFQVCRPTTHRRACLGIRIFSDCLRR